VSIDRVAWEVGYADPGAFRKVFARIVGVAPGEYRRRREAEQGARAA
jgi:transcriptional regulator GlxA family with amidase domain